MPKKFSYSYVKTQIEKIGFLLLSDDYKGSQQKILLECSNGHKFESRFNDIQNNHGCPHCFGNVKKTLNDVKKLFLDNGLILKSENYHNNKDLMDVQCIKCGLLFKSSVSKVNRGMGCKKCKNIKYTKDIVKEKFDSEGYELLSDYYNTKTRLIIKCDKGHLYESTFNRWLSGNRCQECNGTKKHTYEYIKNFIENKKWSLLSTEYKNNYSPLIVKCSNGHITSKSFQSIRSGRDCIECYKNKSISLQEKEVCNYVKTIYDGNIIENDRTTIINPKTNNFLELDIWLPDINKAIEFNGEYWHKDLKRKECDAVKTKMCIRNKISLLIITDEEWDAERDVCLDKIKEFINDRKGD